MGNSAYAPTLYILYGHSGSISFPLFRSRSRARVRARARIPASALPHTRPRPCPYFRVRTLASARYPLFHFQTTTPRLTRVFGGYAHLFGTLTALPEGSLRLPTSAGRFSHASVSPVPLDSRLLAPPLRVPPVLERLGLICTSYSGVLGIIW
jgi:hypothetical protein